MTITLTPFTILLIVLGALDLAIIPVLFTLWWGAYVSH